MIEFQIPSVSDIGNIIHIAAPVIPPVAISASLNKYLEDIRIPICERINEWHSYSRFSHGFCKTVSPFCSVLEVLQTFNVIDSVFPMNIMTIFSGEVAEVNATPVSRIISRARNYREKDRYLNITPNQTDFSATREWTSAPLSISSLSYFAAIHRNSIHLVFAQIAPNCGLENREVLNISTIFSHLVYAVCMQCKSGAFILTVAEMFREHTIDIIMILSALYTTVHIAKPSSSQADTAERFVICKGFRPSTGANMYPYLHQCFADMTQTRRCPGIYTHRFLSIRIPCVIIDKIEELNAVLGQQQLENLKATISLIDNKHRDAKTFSIVRQQTETYEKWRAAHNMVSA